MSPVSEYTETTEQVGQTILEALQNALGLGPSAALSQAQLSNDVSDATIEQADMGEVFDYMCGQPGLSPQLHSYLTELNENYGSYNDVYQGGSSYGGGSGGSSGGGGGGAASSSASSGAASSAAASNTTLVNQVTQNYYSQEITDNSSDTIFTGNFDGDISVDNDHTSVEGDGNAVNTGEGDQNAATGDQSQVIDGDNNGNANTGDGAVQAGEDIEAPVITGENSGTVVDGDVEAPIVNGDNSGTVAETIEDSAVVNGENSGVVAGDDVEDTVNGDGNQTANVDGDANGSQFEFGEGDATNVEGNTIGEGAAVSGKGDATSNNHDESDDDFIDDKDQNDDKDLFDDKDFIDVDVEPEHHPVELHEQPARTLEISHDAPEPADEPADDLMLDS